MQETKINYFLLDMTNMQFFSFIRNLPKCLHCPIIYVLYLVFSVIKMQIAKLLHAARHKKKENKANGSDRPASLFYRIVM